MRVRPELLSAGIVGSLLHIVKEKARSQKGRLSLSSRGGGGGGGERGEVRQCFLFSNTLIIATRLVVVFFFTARYLLVNRGEASGNVSFVVQDFGRQVASTAGDR